MGTREIREPYFSTRGGGGVLPYMGYMPRDRVWFLEVLDP